MKQMILVMTTLMAVSIASGAECTYPVCDIDAKVEQLKAATQNERFQTLKDMRTKYRGETNPENLKNLKIFSEQTKNMLVAANEEDWVIREAQSLKNLTVTALIKYDIIETTYNSNGKNNLMRYFDEINDEASAFDSLSYWSGNVEKLEEVNKAIAVVKFAEYAKVWAVNTNQETYVVREADKVISNGGQNITRLYPAHEGTYSVVAKCMPTPNDCGSMVGAVKFMSIFDSLTTRGLVINISDEIVGVPIYVYTSAQLTDSGTRLRAVSTDSTPNTRVSEVDMKVDRQTGRITGVLRDFGIIGELHFEATPVRRVAKYFSDEGPIRKMDVAETIGRYKGTLGSIEDCTLVVNRYSTGEIVALLDIGAAGNLSFRSGAFNASHAVLTLASTSPIMGDRKLILAFRKDKKGKEVLTGFLMNANPKSPNAEFYRISQ